MRKGISKKKVALIQKNNLYEQVYTLIDQSTQRLHKAFNQELTQLYWNIGKLIQQDILKNKKAEYGDKIIVNLSTKLTKQFGTGWSSSQLWNCLYTVETFPSWKILSTLSRELSWSHLKELIYLKDKLQRTFYAQIAAHEKWSVRQLRERIDSQLFERTAISKKPAKLIQQELSAMKKDNQMSHDLIFRDPYFLDFANLSDTFSEKDLEASIVAELQRFIIELGTDFAFLARQKRITIDGEDYRMDLLFYHRKLRRLVVIDLKLGKFKPGYKAQMELYLNWLDKNEKSLGEETPIGLILCSGKSNEHIKLLTLDKGNIRVAQYLTALPSKKLLQQKLKQAIRIANKRF
jgi:predicted nuclease of restriction endonuclease-like (RecB) superfamily